MLALAEAQSRGHARLIGVSNFPIALLERTERLLGPGAIATNQVEIQPLHAGAEAGRLCAEPRPDPDRLPAALRGCRGVGPRAAAHRREAWRRGLRRRAGVSDGVGTRGHSGLGQRGQSARQLRAPAVTLDDDDMRAIRALHRGERSINPAKSPAWDD